MPTLCARRQMLTSPRELESSAKKRFVEEKEKLIIFYVYIQ
jgi:hypothetical protein